MRIALIVCLLAALTKTARPEFVDARFESAFSNIACIVTDDAKQLDLGGEAHPAIWDQTLSCDNGLESAFASVAYEMSPHEITIRLEAESRLTSSVTSPHGTAVRLAPTVFVDRPARIKETHRRVETQSGEPAGIHKGEYSWSQVSPQWTALPIRGAAVQSSPGGHHELTEARFVIIQPGDLDEDLKIDQIDVVNIINRDKYLKHLETDWFERPEWRDGDFNFDARVDQLDLVAMLQGGHYLQGPYATPLDPLTVSMVIDMTSIYDDTCERVFCSQQLIVVDGPDGPTTLTYVEPARNDFQLHGGKFWEALFEGRTVSPGVAVTGESVLDFNGGILSVDSRSDPAVLALDASTVTVSGGNITGNANGIEAGGQTNVHISGGVIHSDASDTVALAGALVLGESAKAEVTGGILEGLGGFNGNGPSVSTWGDSTLTINDDAAFRGPVYARGQSQIDILGGTFSAPCGRSTCQFVGVNDQGRINIYGGTFEHTAGIADEFWTWQDGVIHVYGTGLTYSADKRLSGFLSDGTPIDVVAQGPRGSRANLVLHEFSPEQLQLPEPTAWTLMTISLFVFAFFGRRRRLAILALVASLSNNALMPACVSALTILDQTSVFNTPCRESLGECADQLLVADNLDGPVTVTYTEPAEYGFPEFADGFRVPISEDKGVTAWALAVIWKSTAIIESGSIGSGSGSAVVAADQATVQLNGGRIGGEISGIAAYGSSHVNVSGGQLFGGEDCFCLSAPLMLHDHATGEISGGQLFGNDFYSVISSGDARLTISGGELNRTVQALGNSVIDIHGGDFPNACFGQHCTVVAASEIGRINIYGGRFQTPPDSPYTSSLNASVDGFIHVYGTDLALAEETADSISGLKLKGTLADGTPIDIWARGNIVLHEIPEPCTGGLLCIPLVMLAATRLRAERVK